MKSILLLIFAWLSFSSFATTYYVSSLGADNNNGTSINTPFLSLSKVNSLSLLSGDSVLFKCGDIFYGSLNVSGSGNTDRTIVYSSYAHGSDPVITGLTNVDEWTKSGNNIWESTSSFDITSCNIVVINNINTAMGRYPNSDFLTYQNHSGSNSITSSDLSGNTDWTGAELVMRSIRWALERNVITSQSGGTIKYIGGNAGTNGYGFFIQNDERTLDTQNEWYFNPLTKKIKIYSTDKPKQVQIPTIDELVLCNNCVNITFDHLFFRGANSHLFENRNSKYITIQHCTFSFAGMNGIYINNKASSNETMLIDNNAFTDCNENAMNFLTWTSNCTIKNNIIKRIGIIPGAGTNSQNSGDGIVVKGANSIAEYNRLDSVGHSGLYVNHSDGIIFRNNYITNFGMTRYDAGGIYSWNTAADTSIINKRIFDHNIILNSNQYISGIGHDDPSLFGIYIDGSSKNTSITNNTIANCKSEGIHLLNSGSCIITGNTCYDNGTQLGLWHAFGGGMNVANNVIKNNIFISKRTTQLVFYFRDDDNASFNKFGIADSNYYVRNADDNLTIQTVVQHTATKRSLADWQKFSGQDAHTRKRAKTIADNKDLLFEYNASNSAKNISLDENYTDAKGASYSGTIVLQPYTSVVLIKN